MPSGAAKAAFGGPRSAATGRLPPGGKRVRMLSGRCRGELRAVGPDRFVAFHGLRRTVATAPDTHLTAPVGEERDAERGTLTDDHPAEHWRLTNQSRETELTNMAENDSFASAGREVEQIPVSVNYDIIRLFSEGLYKSPHKAIEELVSNGYDAGAERVHVLLPEPPDNASGPLAPLWVIDDGHGMDVGGFRQLWRVAESKKNGPSPKGRAPIGQFGIGKLAAYVLAWKLTHVSRVDSGLLLTSMNFRDVRGRQNDADAPPVEISLRKVSEQEAKTLLAEIETRDPAAWKLMFDKEQQCPTWTAAALSDFKDLYHKLSAGRLRWVLSTGLPLHSDFSIWLNGGRVQSSKENLPEIKTIILGGDGDVGAGKLDGSKLDGGKIGDLRGRARIFEKPLSTGKAGEVGRSHGFFIRVRRRVINLEDELFGLEALNHAAWSRFALEVDADGLRDHLLSSREGVRDSDDVRRFRDYLRCIFNTCRKAYEKWEREQREGLDIGQLLSDGPSAHVTEPLFKSVRNAVETGTETFYIQTPAGVPEEDRSEWLEEFEGAMEETPFDKTTFEKEGSNAPALRYDPSTRTLVVNAEHPFIDKLTNGDKQRNPARLFASSEVLLEGQLQDHGISRTAATGFLRDRDRVLRLAAGEAPPTAAEVVRRLNAATRDSVALERAVGAAFRALGFVYERKGGAASGPDGILDARLGRHREGPSDYRLVYDAKQTNQPAIPADKIGLASLENFRKQAEADFGFFIATAYAAEAEDAGKLNQNILADDAYRSLTLLKVDHLHRLVRLHYQHGVTLTELRGLFENARTTSEADAWIDKLEKTLQQSEIPVASLLHGLEQEKSDPKETPNIRIVRAKNPALHDFEPERLVARLKAVEGLVGVRWIEVEEDGDVRMHQRAGQILATLDREIGELASESHEEQP